MRMWFMVQVLCQNCLPFGGSLLKVAMEHFAFLSAESEAKQQHRSPGGSGSDQLQARMEHMETALATLSSNMDMLVQKLGTTLDPPDAAPARPSALKKKRAKPSGASVAPASRDQRVQFQGLDPSVVAAATSAGVSAKALEQMEMLVSASAPGAKKLLEPRAKPAPAAANPLSESEEEEEVPDGQKEEPGSVVPLNPLEKAVTQMADILNVLTSDRASKAKGSRVEAALDAVSSTTLTDGVAIGSGKKAAAARRALRQALVDCPRRYLEHGGEVDDGRSSLEDPGSRDARSRALCQSMGGAQVPYRVVQKCCPQQLGRGRHFGRPDTGPDCKCTSTCMPFTPPIRPSSGRQRKLGPSGRAKLGGGASPRFTISTCGTSSERGGGPVLPRWAEIALSHLRDTDDYVTKRRNLSSRKANKDADPKLKGAPKGKAKPGGPADTT